MYWRNTCAHGLVSGTSRLFRPFLINVQPVVNLFGYRRFLNRKVPALVQLNRKGEESSPSLCDLLAWKYQAVPLEYRFAGYSNIEPSALLLFCCQLKECADTESFHPGIQFVHILQMTSAQQVVGFEKIYCICVQFQDIVEIQESVRGKVVKSIFSNLKPQYFSR